MYFHVTEYNTLVYAKVVKDRTMNYRKQCLQYIVAIYTI